MHWQRNKSPILKLKRFGAVGQSTAIPIYLINLCASLDTLINP